MEAASSTSSMSGTNDDPLQPAKAEGGLPQPQRFWAVLVILLGLGQSVLDGSVTTLALPAIAQALQMSEAQSVWIVSANQIALLCLLLPAASLGNRMGQKRLFLLGTACFAVAALLCIFAANLWMLIIGRALQGACAATIMTSMAVLVRRTYPASLLGRGIALNAFVVGMASVAGPPVAALVLALGSWQWLFALCLPASALVLWLGPRYLPDDVPVKQHVPVKLLDVFLNIAMFGLIFTSFKLLVGAMAAATSLALPVMMMVMGVMLGVWYVRRQRLVQEPVLPLDLLRIRVFRLSLCASVSAFSVQMIGFIAMPFMLIVSLGHDAVYSGLLMSVWPLAMVLTAPLAGRLIGKISSSQLGFAGMLMLALGMALLALLPPTFSFFDAAWPLVVCGVGFALFQSPNNHTIITSAPASRAGFAGGMLSTARLTGQTVGATVTAAIFAIYPPANSAWGASISFGVCTVFALMAAFFSLARGNTLPQGRGETLGP